MILTSFHCLPEVLQLKHRICFKNKVDLGLSLQSLYGYGSARDRFEHTTTYRCTSSCCLNRVINILNALSYAVTSWGTSCCGCADGDNSSMFKTVILVRDGKRVGGPGKGSWIANSHMVLSGDCGRTVCC